MKYIYISLFFILFNLEGCAEPQINIVIPPGSSKELGVRSNRYNRAMAKHSLDEKATDYYSNSYKNSQKFNFNNTLASNQVLSPTILPSIINERRKALVIGNANYINGGRLSNPINDAKAMAQLLQDLGFKVSKYEDARQIEMKKAIDDFGRSLQDYDVSLFFYAGHEVQVEGNNYLIPIDADLSSENDVEYNCVHAGRILAKMEDAACKTNIIILDACRNNPFERSWTRDINIKGYGKGLAFMNAPSGSIIAYSTSPGNTASDGISGKNGVYTAALLQHIRTPNITIEAMFKRVRMTVEEKTNNKQVPWESTSLKGNFFFKVQKK